MRDGNLRAVLARSTFRSQKVKKHHMLGPFWDVEACSVWQAQGILHLATHEQTVKVLRQSKTLAGVVHLKRIWKDACHVAGAMQETCSSEMLEVRALIS